MKRPARSMLVVLILCMLSACGGAAVSDEPQAAPVDEAVLPTMWAESDERLVTVLATLGPGHARSVAYGFDEVEAVLTYWDPDLVLVDVPSSSLAAAVSGEGVEDVFLAQHPEVTEVILPNASRLGYVVQAIGAGTAEGLEDRRQWEADNPAGPPNRLLIALTARLRALWLANEAENDPIWMHGAEYLEASRLYSSWLSYEVEEDLGADGELRRMARMTQRMGTALDESDAARVMIFVDPGTRWFIEGAVDARDDVRRVPGGQHFRR